MLDQIDCAKKFLVRGNHDVHPTREYLRFFDEVYGLVSKKGYWLSHAPVHPDELRGRWNIHGHVHQNSLMTDDKVFQAEREAWDKRYINVCVEALNGHPISLEEIRAGEYWKRKVT